MQIPRDITHDNVSGASTIMRNVLEWLRSELGSEKNFDPKELMHLIEGLAETFPNFAIIRHFIQSLDDFLRSELLPTEVAQIKILKFLDDYLKTRENSQIMAVQNLISGVQFDNKTVLLHSHSKSIVLLFEALAVQNLKLKIIQTVSEPCREGIIQARRLAECGFPVSLINEAAASRFMHETDMFISGADAIYPDYVVNKTGTMQLALLCLYFGKPYYVLADSSKIIPAVNQGDGQSLGFTEEEKNPDEILSHAPSGIQPVNFYFEPIPRSLISCIFTD